MKGATISHKNPSTGPHRRSRAAIAVIASLIALSMASGSAIPSAAQSTEQGQTPQASRAPQATCPPGGQCFADVLPANPFYVFINRLYQQDVISGYACGGPAEPCDAQSRPYYRPNDNVNRQQMAKFVDQARHMPGIFINTATNGQPLYSLTTLNNGIGVFGEGPGGTGVRGSGEVGVSGIGDTGVEGVANVTGGKGVSGSGKAVGVQGIGISDGMGVRGDSTTSYGVLGYSNSSYGVNGTSTSSTGVRGMGAGVGVQGVTANGGGIGVRGDSTSSYGVLGYSTNSSGVYGSSINGNGVRGLTATGDDAKAGVVGESTAEDGTGVIGIAGSGGLARGVWGSSTDGVGVYGESTGSTGVRGKSDVASGVYGTSDDYYGVRGESNNGTGVYGKGELLATGVVGLGIGGRGVVGSSTADVGVYGVSIFSDAGYFDGDVVVTGSCCNAAQGTYRIDHPLDPANKYLTHSAVESADQMNIYNGNVTTDAAGQAIVTLPSWFEALNTDYRYQLTVMGQFAQAIVSSKISNNSFTIKTDKPNVEVSWQVTGIRKDPYATQHPIPVESNKDQSDQGKYLHPTEYGQPESNGIGYEKRVIAPTANSEP